MLAIAAMGIAFAMRGCGGGDPPPCAANDDLDPCTLDTCKDGVTTHTYLGDGYKCFYGKLRGECVAGVCDIPCQWNAQCVDGLPCTVDACEGGRCAFRAGPDPGAWDDGNKCTQDVCLDDRPVYVPMPDGTPCGEQDGLLDDHPVIIECTSGYCEWCEVSADCGKDTECRLWKCENHKCKASDRAEGTPLAAVQVQSDCRIWVCDGHGNPKLIVDPDDHVKDDDPCYAWQCDGHTPVRKPTSGNLCAQSTGDPGICAEGQCVGCVKHADCLPPNDRCLHGECVGCSNGKTDGEETGEDCGGECGACLGDMCTQMTDCATLNCAFTNLLTPDRVCCKTPCDGMCQQCGTDGLCVPVPTGLTDKNLCSSPGEACSDGVCKTKLNYPCVSSFDCITNFCDSATHTCKTGP
jgi:hypothetical protein